MTGSRMNHAPSHLREQFQEWLDSSETDRLPEIDIRPVAPLLDAWQIAQMCCLRITAISWRSERAALCPSR